jgi:hypothetical protein
MTSTAATQCLQGLDYSQALFFCQVITEKRPEIGPPRLTRIADLAPLNHRQARLRLVRASGRGGRVRASGGDESPPRREDGSDEEIEREGVTGWLEASRLPPSRTVGVAILLVTG